MTESGDDGNITLIFQVRAVSASDCIGMHDLDKVLAGFELDVSTFTGVAKVGGT